MMMLEKNTPEQEETPNEVMGQDSTPTTLSDKRKALFEPLEPTSIIGRTTTAESLLPPPDFDEASYPRGWPDREIDGLNKQLEEDSRCLEDLQIQLLEERSKRADVERQNTMLQNQITMLMDMLQDNEGYENLDDEGAES